MSHMPSGYPEQLLYPVGWRRDSYAKRQIGFDLVYHVLVINKMLQLGVNPLLVQIIKNYLTNCTQKYGIDRDWSKSYPVTSGVPQGFLLGPFLFKIFINDLQYIFLSECKMYAEDIKLYNTTKNSVIVQ